MSASIDNPHFLLRRLHSLLGLVPVGAFLVFHLWENSQSRFGAGHYNSAVFGALQRLNYLPALEILVIALPLLFHAGYGLVILRQGRAEVRRYPWLHNRLHWLQRLSGLGILAFLLVHLGLTRIRRLWEPTIAADLFGQMQAMLSEPWLLALYVAGLLLAVFHLANGLWTMAIVWGLTASARAQSIWGYCCAALGLALAAIGLHGILGFLP